MSFSVKFDDFTPLVQSTDPEIPTQAAKITNPQVTNTDTHQWQVIETVEQARAIAEKMKSIRAKSNNPL